jgi:hypothetical protein
MSPPISPFRILSKTYANQMLTREQYVSIRAQLLKKLERQGQVTEEDLNNFTDIIHGKKLPHVEKSYSSSDWLIIGLGLVAAIVLGFVLYG